MKLRFATDALFATDYTPPGVCQFGIVTGALLAGLGDIGITGGLASGIAGGLEGAGVGAALSGITGGNPLTGALTGGLTGGAVGAFGPAIGSATGLGTAAGDAIAGGAAGLAGAALTGGNILTGGLEGAAGGLASSSLSGGPASGTGSSTAVTTSPVAGTGGGTSAGSTTGAIAPPAGGVSGDLASGAGVAPLPGGTGGGGTVSDLGLSSGSFAGDLLASPDVIPAGSTATQMTTAGAGGGGLSNIFGSGGVSKLFSNPGVLLGGAALGADLLMGNQPLPAENQLNQLAGEQQSVGRALSSYIFSGTLPPGAQQAVTNATTAATAKVKSTFAALGLGGSTQEAQAVQQIQSQAAAQTYLMADQLLQQGANYSQLSDQLYQTLLQTQLSEQNQLTSAIGTFAAGLAGAGLKAAA